MRLLLIILLAIGMGETGCSTPGRGSNEWRATLANGDKPGIGLIVWEKAGLIVDGRFCLLDPDFPGDFRHAGIVVPMENIKSLKTGYGFTISLISAGKVMTESRLLIVEGAFSGSAVKVKLQGSIDDEPVEMEFHRAP